MTTLSFKLNGFKASKFLNMDLPVEVRKPNLALVARTLTTQKINVVPGTYFVTATLPAGQELLTQIEVKTSDTTAELSPEPDDVSPLDSHEQHHYLGKPFDLIESVSSYTEMEFKKSPRQQTRTVRVSLLAGRDPITASGYPHHTKLDFERLNKGAQYIYEQFSSYGSRHYLEAVQPDGSATRVALPTSDVKKCFVVLRALSPQLTAADVHLENIEADLLLRAAQTGRQVSIAESVTMSPNTLLFEDSQQLVQQKMADPIAAAVGAYTLLSWGELDRLHDWTENLKNWFTWLPDGLAIRGEHLAQLGRHEDAMKNFMDLPLRGSPLFRDGLSYAIDRLNLYTQVKSAKFSSELIQKASHVLAWLQPIATHVDFSEPILTLRGLTPSADTESTTTVELQSEFTPIQDQRVRAVENAAADATEEDGHAESGEVG